LRSGRRFERASQRRLPSGLANGTQPITISVNRSFREAAQPPQINVILNDTEALSLFEAVNKVLPQQCTGVASRHSAEQFSDPNFGLAQPASRPIPTNNYPAPALLFQPSGR
jgi:hypothetical protein